MTSLITALGIDKQQINGQFIAIEENKTADASCFISMILDHQCQNKRKVILILFHNTVGHYQGISLKLGYNLSNLQNAGSVIVIDMLKTISESLCTDFSKPINNEDILKNLYFEIEKETEENCCIILENVTNLLSLGSKLKDVLNFTQYVQSLMYTKTCSIVFTFHKLVNNKILCNFLKHQADVTVEVSDLKTGKAVDVSGSFVLRRKKKSDLLDLQNTYHYQLLERNINVFAPGTKGM